MIKIKLLPNIDIKATYECNAQCKHCLFACSPKRSGGYMTDETAKDICQILQKANFKSVHIGGGEVFLDFNSLTKLVEIVLDSGLTITRVETNGFWAANEERAIDYIRNLKLMGVDGLQVSLDPFHMQYIPIALPLRLAELCKLENFPCYLHKEKYARYFLSEFDPTKTHSLEELEQKISKDFVKELIRSYGIIPSGRAVALEHKYGELRPVKELAGCKPCKALLSSGNYRIDVYKKLVPMGCTGIALPLQEAIEGIPEGKYPVFETLFNGGTIVLLEYAQKLGFVPLADGYTSECAMCFHTRHWLCKNHPNSHPELFLEHYEESLG